MKQDDPELHVKPASLWLPVSLVLSLTLSVAAASWYVATDRAEVHNALRSTHAELERHEREIREIRATLSEALDILRRLETRLTEKNRMSGA